MSHTDRLFNYLLRQFEDPDTRIRIVKWWWRISLAMLITGYIILFYLLFKPLQ